MCAVYIDFIASTLPDIACAGRDSGASRPLSVQMAALATAPLVLGLAQIQSFHWLAWTSTLGNVAVLGGAVAVVVAGAYGSTVEGISMASWGALPHLKPGGLPRAIGQIAFLFAIHIVTLPILAEQGSAPAAARSLGIGFGIVTASNVAFGLAAAMLFGLNTPANVLDALSSGWVLQVVRALLCLDLLLTAPMVLAAGRQVVERFVVGGMREARQARAEARGVLAGERQGWGRHRETGAEGEKSAGASAPGGTNSEAVGSEVGHAARRQEDEALGARACLASCLCWPCTRWLARRGGWDEHGARVAVRVCLVVVAYALAFGIPDFGDLLALVGGGVNCTIGYTASTLVWLMARGRAARMARHVLEQLPEEGQGKAGGRPGAVDVREAVEAIASGEPSTASWVVHCGIALFGVASAVASTVTVAMDLGGGGNGGHDKCP